MWGGCGGHGCSSSSYGYGGGYGSGYGVRYGEGHTPSQKPFPPPPGADPKLWSWFIAGDYSRSGALSATGLQKALTKGGWTSFDVYTANLLMGIVDVHRSGVILFSEFIEVYREPQDRQGVFLRFDRDRSGTIDGNELQAALNQLGYKHSPDLLNKLEDKYDIKWSTPPGITLDRFVRACVVARKAA